MKKSITCLVCQTSMVSWFKRGMYTYYACGHCHTITTLPIPTAAHIHAHYLQKFKTGNYFLAREFSGAYLTVYQQFVGILQTFCQRNDKQLRGLRVLDVGCFTGDFLSLLAEQKADVYGSELQRQAVKLANQKLPGRIMLADIDSKHFPKKDFDAITMLGLIEHVTDPISLVKATHRLLRPAGILMIQTPNSRSSVGRLLGRWWPPLAPIEHIHLFSDSGLVQLLRDAGYENIKVVPHIKWLPIAYVYHQFSNFGPHFLTLLKPFDWLLANVPNTIKFPFYGGEMIVLATKR